LPSLPRAAFDPCRARPIKYGVYDGSPARLADTGEIWVFGGGTWYIPSRPTQVFCYDCGVLTEQAYRRNFGHYDLPPLPAHAFRGLRKLRRRAADTERRVHFQPLAASEASDERMALAAGLNIST
jgi:hypothetical protein